MPTEDLKKRAEELFQLVTKDPNHPNAGNFARAAAGLLADAEHASSHIEAEKVKTAEMRAAIADGLRQVIEFTEKQREAAEARYAKPPEAPTELTPEKRAENAKRMVDSAIATSVATSLLQQACRLEEFCETGIEPGSHGQGVEQHGKQVHAGRIDQAREAAKKYRARAAELLANVDPSMLGRVGLAALGA
jgi:hypothetical protein